MSTYVNFLYLNEMDRWPNDCGLVGKEGPIAVLLLGLKNNHVMTNYVSPVFSPDILTMQHTQPLHQFNTYSFLYYEIPLKHLYAGITQLLQ